MHDTGVLTFNLRTVIGRNGHPPQLDSCEKITIKNGHLMQSKVLRDSFYSLWITGIVAPCFFLKDGWLLSNTLAPFKKGRLLTAIYRSAAEKAPPTAHFTNLLLSKNHQSDDKQVPNVSKWNISLAFIDLIGNLTFTISIANHLQLVRHLCA